MCECVLCVCLLPGVPTWQRGTRRRSGGSPRSCPCRMTAIGTPRPAWGRRVAPVGWGPPWGGSGGCPGGDSGTKGDGEPGTIGVMCPGLATPCSNPCPNMHPAWGTCREVFSFLLRTLQGCRVCKAQGEAGREENLASPPPSHLPPSPFKSLPCITFSSGMGAPRSETTSLAQGQAWGRVWACNLCVIGPCPEFDPRRCSLGLVVTTSLQMGAKTRKLIKREKQLFSNLTRPTSWGTGLFPLPLGQVAPMPSSPFS